jgi:hypothetical protein
MIRFEEILSALAAGRSVRRHEWEQNLRLFVLDTTLVCKLGDSRPYRHDLSWDDVKAQDWEIVQDSPLEQHPRMIQQSPLEYASSAGRVLPEETTFGASLVFLLSSRKWKL